MTTPCVLELEDVTTPCVLELEDVTTPVWQAEFAQMIVGPPGPQGPPGPIGDPGGALLVTNRLSELATDPQAQTDAQANLGLGATDPLAYYILAKA